MKTLSEDEIESLLGVCQSEDHPLDILGYGFTSEGVRRFRAERPDFLPQIFAYVQRILRESRVFPALTSPDDAGFKTFIHADGAAFKVSRMEEIGVGRYERISSGPLSEAEAIREYVRRVVNPDYIRCP